jgi:hypothetical protein
MPQAPTDIAQPGVRGIGTTSLDISREIVYLRLETWHQSGT